MITPTYLKPGDTVVLIAPARSVSKIDIESFECWVSANGWELECAPNLFCTYHQFAGTDEQRCDDLAWALSHPTAKAIFTARGGYGSMRTLASLESKVVNLDQWLSKQTPKWFVGFSDMTTIHLWLNKNEWASIHGPVATQWGQKHLWVKANVDGLQGVLMGQSTSLPVKREQVNSGKAFSGQLVGGNLSLLYAALGTPLQPNTVGKVLLIEDLDEYLYHIDRMLRSCKAAGLFEGIEALVVGSMIDMKDNATPFGRTPREMITEALGDFGFPMLFDVEIGHDQRNHAVKLGCDITFDLSNLTQQP